MKFIAMISMYNFPFFFSINPAKYRAQSSLQHLDNIKTDSGHLKQFRYMKYYFEALSVGDGYILPQSPPYPLRRLPIPEIGHAGVKNHPSAG
jgi:hypothetical protein